MKIRRIQPQDRPGLKTLLHAQSHFRPEEIRVALELIDIALAQPGEEDYMILCAEGGDGTVQGYICFGKAPLTEAVYDIYWIVVHPAYWGQGTGSSLLRQAEDEMARRQARLLLIETSSTFPYDLARAFYGKHGYREQARVLDYYRPEDHKIIYGKKLR
ncbi:MAG: GNAT family N-acetyltransferase [Syntrophaceae bacterium]|nr:GNAT family N-acetyltransferase [Syntrophaceae bacterium]